MANQSPERKGIRQSNCPFRLFCPLKAPSPHCATLCTDCKNSHPRNVRAQIKNAASQTGNGFFSPSTDVLETMCPAPKQEIKSQKKPRYALKKRLAEELPRKGTLSKDALLPRIPQSYRRTLIPCSRERIRFSRRTLGSSAPGWREVTTARPMMCPAFAVPVIGTDAPDVVEHNGLALVLPYI